MADLLSSPDPLNDAPAYSPIKTRRASKRNSIQPRESSPKKQTFELDVGDRISPQKIRVTVEAGSDQENGYRHTVGSTHAGEISPSRPRANRRREKTTTTKVPVKGLSDSEDNAQETSPPKRGRGRPRKSIGTPVIGNKSGRAGTPTRKRRSIGDLVGGDDEEDCDFQIGNDVQLGRGKGRSRSRSSKRKSISTVVTGADSNTAGKRGRGWEKRLLHEEVVVLEEDDHETDQGFDDQELTAAEAGILGDVDVNEAYTQSAYSTLRSTTPVGANDPDLVIARFNPGNETPKRVGWSSPRPVESARTSSPNITVYPSASISSEKALGQYRENNGHVSEHSRVAEQEEYEDEAQDGLGEMREFDTILESEEFSMISVDSVPSLREHLSSPPTQDDASPSTMAHNKSSPATKERPPAVKDAPSCVPKVLRGATAPAQITDYLSVTNSRMDDTFSSIPPQILEAATPARKSHHLRLQSRRNSGADDSFSSIAPEILEAATPGRELPKKPNNSQIYEDSFPAMPPAVLDSATPARHVSTWKRPSQPSATSQKLANSASIRAVLSRQNTSDSALTRLPTPDETPPPTTDCMPQASVSSNSNPAARATGQSSAKHSSIHSQMRSSPPSAAARRYTYTAHFRQKRELYPEVMQTPSIVFSSPTLPPPIQNVRGQPFLAVQTEEVDRPGLSPIARAGRALQDAVGPALSPRVRALSLGSPFKSPVTEGRPSSSGGPNPSPAQDENVKSQGQATHLFPNLWSKSNQHDDPFGNSDTVRHCPEVPVSNNQGYTLGLPEQRAIAGSRLSTIKLEGHSMLSNDAMSWQADDEVTADDATTSLVNDISRERSSSIQSGQPIGTEQTMEQKWATDRAAVRKQIQNANSSQVIHIESDEEFPADGGHVEDDKDFGLLLETLHSSSPTVQQTQPLLQDNLDKPRRGKIPSPWRKNSKRLVYNDELSHLSSPGKLPLGKRQLWENAEDDDNESIDLSSMVIPPKAAFHTNLKDSGNLDLSALLASSPSKNRPPILKNTQPRLSDQSRPRFGIASTHTSGSDETRGSRHNPSAPVLQKANFQPRNRDVGNAEDTSIFDSSPLKPSTYTNNIFGAHVHRPRATQNPTPELSSSSVAEPLGLSSPSRTNVLRPSTEQTPTQDSEVGSTFVSSIFSNPPDERELTSGDKRTLKWTESVHLASAPLQPLTSPTKSILRSPLKTPGHGSASGSEGANRSPSKNVAFVSSSPIPPSPMPEPLSSTTWSKAHWKLLKSIYHAWRPDLNGGSTDGPYGRRRNSTRVISRLMGKNCFWEGETMRLEQWHLEIVDEFRGEVPGWDEKVIAVRLFSLMMSEKVKKEGIPLVYDENGVAHKVVDAE